MDQSDTTVEVDSTFTRIGAPYMVVGSMALMACGEPRLTLDIDVVIDLSLAQVGRFCDAFPEDRYYCSRPSVEDSVRRKFPFKVIDNDTGLKIDLMPATATEFDRAQLARARRVEFEPGKVATFASPEDVIVKKLAFFKEGGSDKHVRDILGVLKISREKIDRDYISRWAAHFGCSAEWQLVLSQSVFA